MKRLGTKCTSRQTFDAEIMLITDGYVAGRRARGTYKACRPAYSTVDDQWPCFYIHVKPVVDNKM